MLVPEAKPRDTNGPWVLSPLYNLGRKHILMARSVAEGLNLYGPQIRPIIANNSVKVIYQMTLEDRMIWDNINRV